MPCGSNSFSDIIASTSSLLGISVLVLAVFLVYKKRKCLLPWQRSTTAPRLHSLLRSQLKSYTYSEVRKMTKSFTHTLVRVDMALFTKAVYLMVAQ